MASPVVAPGTECASGVRDGERSPSEESSDEDVLDDPPEACSDSEAFASSTESSEEGVSDAGRLWVFCTLSLGVQTFLSYAGGATPMAVTTIRRSGDWSNFDADLLGALDKIGQLISAPLWGMALQRIPAKRLLVVSLFLNAASSLLFGYLGNKYAMFLSKFTLGCTETPNIVWGNLWTAMNAPPSRLSLWMNLGGVAAGVGTALGGLVAGFSQHMGLPYSFAYLVEATALLALWVALVFTPEHLVNLPRKRNRAPETGPRPGKRLDTRPGLCGQLVVLATNGLYLLTMLSIGMITFVAGGNQWYWPQFFKEGPWKLNGLEVTWSNLLVPAVGMGLGIFLGPVLIDACGGYQDDLGRTVTLNLLWRLTGVGAFGAGMIIFALGWRMSHDDHLDVSLGDPALWGFWLGTVPVNFVLSSQQGVLTVINLESVDRGVQELAQGITTSFQNLFGYAGGIIGPSLVSSASVLISKWLSRLTLEQPHLWSPEEWQSWRLSVAVICLFFVVFFLFPTVGAAQRLSYRRLKAAQGFK